MKKINLFLTVLFIFAAVTSCNLIPWDDLTVNEDRDLTAINKTKTYKGGNVTCDQVSELYPNLDLMMTTGRNDFNQSEKTFEFSWPDGLEVMVKEDGSVSFQIDGSIDLGDGKCYMVGAVIVKGGSASNIYTYPEGAAYDIGLVAPNNASGNPAALSNLTFCFVECEGEVIAIKSYYYFDESGTTRAAVSEGNLAFPGNGNWCDTWLLGYNDYPATGSFNMTRAGTSTVVGTVSVDENGVVTITMNEGLTIDRSYVYVGTLWDLHNSNLSNYHVGCPIYQNWEYDDTDGQIQVFFED